MRLVTLRDKAAAVAVAAVGLLVMWRLGLHGSARPDWHLESERAFHALVTGHVVRFLQLAPAYGGSLILRAPFVMVTTLWHGGDGAVYTASAVPCLAAAGALGVWLSTRMRGRGSSTLACAVALLLCVANPLTLPALELGHPEELLSAALCIAAVLCALTDRPIWAAILVGLAIANKQWAVLAVGPVLVALPGGRLRALLITGAVSAAVVAPLFLVGSGVFATQATAVGLDTGATFQPWQIWWFFGSHASVAKDMTNGIAAGYRSAPGWVAALGHPLVIAIMPPLTALYARLRRDRVRRGGPAPVDALLLLALLLGLRCVLDPWDISYYSLPFLLALLTWEGLSFQRPPVMSLVASLLAWFIFRGTSSAALNLSADAQALVFAVVSIPSIMALAVPLYAPGVGRLLAPRVRGTDPVAATV
jgi:hypothetical protein